MLAAGAGEEAGVVGAGDVGAVSVFASVFVSGFASVLPSGFASDFAASVAASGPGFLPSRKSVTYQPLPFSWNPGAVNCLAKVAPPHAGHTLSGASLIFCNASLVWPQDEHLYA